MGGQCGAEVFNAHIHNLSNITWAADLCSRSEFSGFFGQLVKSWGCVLYAGAPYTRVCLIRGNLWSEIQVVDFGMRLARHVDEHITFREPWQNGPCLVINLCAQVQIPSRSKPLAFNSFPILLFCFIPRMKG